MTAGEMSQQKDPTPLRVSGEGIAIGALGFLCLLGVTAGMARLLNGLGSTTALNDTTSWGIWIGFDFALIAFSGAAFTMAAVVHVLHLHQFEPALRPALLVGLLGYVAVLALLVLDLGRPDRFYSFLINWNLHSPLFEISWCVLLYSTILVMEVSPDALGRIPGRWSASLRKLILWAMPIVTIVGVTLSTLHQSTLGTLYLNMPHRLSPLWWTPLLPVLFFTSAVLAGLSMAVIAYRVAVRLQGAEEDPRVRLGLGWGIAVVGLCYMGLRIVGVYWGVEVLGRGWTDSQGMFMAVEVLLGVVLPVVLLLTPGTRTKSLTGWVAPSLVLLGVLMNRFSATLYGQSALVDTVPYVPSVVEWLSTIGIIAGAMLAWMVGVRLLVRFDDRMRSGSHGDSSHGAEAMPPLGGL